MVGCFFLQQALEFFDHLMKILGDHASIRFSFTMHDGMAVGVTWRLGNEILSFHMTGVVRSCS